MKSKTIHSTAPSRRRFRPIDWKLVTSYLLLAIVAYLVVVPLAMLLINSFQLARPGFPPIYGLSGWQRAFADPQLISAFWNTISLTAVREGFAIVLGVFIAWLIARTDLPGKTRLEFLFWIAFFLPPLPVTMGWILLLDGRRGLVNGWLEGFALLPSPLFNIYSYWGIVWAHLGQSIGIKVLLLTPAFRNLNAQLEEASWASGAGVLQTLRLIVVPLMLPAIMVTTILGIIRALDAFEVELLLGVPVRLFVYSTRIRDLISTGSPDFAAASALGTLFLFALLLLVAFQRRFVGSRNYQTIGGRGFSSHQIPLNRWRWPLFTIVTLFTVLITIVPVIVLAFGTFMTAFGHFDLPQVWTTQNWVQVLRDPLLSRAFRNTLLVALGTALIGPLFFFLIAYVVVKMNFAGQQALDLLSWLPWAVPGILTGFALLWTIFWTPMMASLYGTVQLLILAMLIKNMPMGTQLGKSVLMQLGESLEEASKASGANWFQTTRHIVFPLIRPTLITIGVFGFMSASRDISSIVLLGSSQTQTLALLALDFAVSVQFEKATVVALMTVMIVITAAGAARLAGSNLAIGSGPS
jgi:iron(III) transport system permease protein